MLNKKNILKKRLQLLAEELAELYRKLGYGIIDDIINSYLIKAFENILETMNIEVIKTSLPFSEQITLIYNKKILATVEI